MINRVIDLFFCYINSRSDYSYHSCQSWSSTWWILVLLVSCFYLLSIARKLSLDLEQLGLRWGFCNEDRVFSRTCLDWRLATFVLRLLCLRTNDMNVVNLADQGYNYWRKTTFVWSSENGDQLSRFCWRRFMALKSVNGDGKLSTYDSDRSVLGIW